MKQVGELVVAKNRLAALSGEARDPVLTELSERISRLVSAMQTEVHCRPDDAGGRGVRTISPAGA